jgi:glycosyltransferase involved in cell wall biosynthesis
MPSVSVLLPVHNGEKYIGAAIESLLSQDFEDFEVVVVDGGSCDRTAEVVRGYGDRRIVLHQLIDNSGLTVALNTGLLNSKSDLIARLDADDQCAPGRLRLQVEEMARRPNLGVLGGSAWIINSVGDVIGERNTVFGERSVLRTLRWRNPLMHSSVMFRRELVRSIGGYRDMRQYEDYDLWLRMAAKGPIDNLNEKLIAYRIHPGQVTRRRVFDSEAIRAVRISRVALSRVNGESTLNARVRSIAWSSNLRLKDLSRTK